MTQHVLGAALAYLKPPKRLRAGAPKGACTSLACPTASCGDLVKCPLHTQLRGTVQRLSPEHGPRASPLWRCVRAKTPRERIVRLTQLSDPLIPSSSSPNQLWLSPKSFRATAATKTECHASCTTGSETTFLLQSTSYSRRPCLGSGPASRCEFRASVQNTCFARDSTVPLDGRSLLFLFSMTDRPRPGTQDRRKVRSRR